MRAPPDLPKGRRRMKRQRAERMAKVEGLDGEMVEGQND